VRRFHDEVEVTPHQAEAKHLNRGTRLRPSQQREKDSRPLKIPGGAPYLCWAESHVADDKRLFDLSAPAEKGAA
jgi:hypothetical protein